MRPRLPGLILLLAGSLIVGAVSTARAQITAIPSGTNGCFVNSSSNNTDCAQATFSLMTGGSINSSGTVTSPGIVVSGTSATNVTGIQIVLQNTTPLGMTNYGNADVLTGFFWGISSDGTSSGTTYPLSIQSNGGSAYTPGSVIGTNSAGGNAIANPSACSSVAVCTSTAINVGGYWASSYKAVGWTGTPGTFPGAYAISTSGYGLISLGQGNPTGTGDPTLVSNGNSSLNLGLVGGAGSTVTAGKPAVQDTVTIQLAFASTISSLNLNTSLIFSDIFFAYGTNPDASTAGMTKAMEPASIAVFGVAILAISIVRHRRMGLTPAV